MAAKESTGDAKRRPSVQTKTVSFGEERNGGTRTTRPGTSPTTPKGKRYPSTPPPHPKKIDKAKPKKGSIIGTSALAVKIRKLANGSLSFTEPGGRKVTIISPLDDQVVVNTPTISSPTGGFKNTPSILHGGVDFWKNGNFKFANTSGWKCVSRQDKPSGHEEEWIYVGEDSPPTTPKGKKTSASPKSPPPAPKKTQKYTGYKPLAGDPPNSAEGNPFHSSNLLKAQSSRPKNAPTLFGSSPRSPIDFSTGYVPKYYAPPNPRLHSTVNKHTGEQLSRINPHTGRLLSDGAWKFYQLMRPGGPMHKDKSNWQELYDALGHLYPNLANATTINEATAESESKEAVETSSRAKSNAPKAPTKKAKKNKKAREKKAVVKKNLGKRQKLPYVPKEVLGKGSRVTRSKKVTQFFALP